MSRNSKEANENANLVGENPMYATKLEEEHDVQYQHIGSIGNYDFITWTLIAIVGIIFCVLHCEQERFWHYTGPTTKDAQSLWAKTVVSVFSTIIGASLVAILMKTTVALSFTFAKYYGARFSQLVTTIGGYQPSHILMLTGGGGWFEIIIIVLTGIISAVTKQLAVVSMGVSLVTTSQTILSYTPDYSYCESSPRSLFLEGSSSLLGMDLVNSIRNPNFTHTNEFYDTGIPATLRGNSTFQRILPYGDASCYVFNTTLDIFDDTAPNVTSISPSAWSTMVTIRFHDEEQFETLPMRRYVNCTLNLGYATATTTCNDTSCNTTRTSKITPYGGAGPGVTLFLKMTFNMLTPLGWSAGSRNPLAAWLLGGNITDFYRQYTVMPGQTLDLVQSRMNILSTVSARVLCDYNMHDPHNSTIPITSLYQLPAYYKYSPQWTWPFWLLAGIILVLWMVCMWALYATPEARVLSVEWLLSQYIYNNRWTYLSGRQLVVAHQDTVFHVKEGFNPHEQAENIIISKSEPSSGDSSSTVRIRHKKQYL